MKKLFLCTLMCLLPLVTIIPAYSDAVKVIPAYKYIRIGTEDLETSQASDNWSLIFGKGNSSGMWAFDYHRGNFSIGRGWDVTNNGAFLINLTPDRRVGIDVWQPNSSAKLDVMGKIMADGTLLISDERSKKDITSLTTDFNALLKLNPIKYHNSGNIIREQLELFKQTEKDRMSEEMFNSEIQSFERRIKEREADTATKFGFSAQQLREIYPNLVYEDDLGYLSVDYIGLIPVLVDVVKQQQVQINQLQTALAKVSGEELNKDASLTTLNAVLYQNTPNPFSNNTEIKYYVPSESANASIRIYDLVGNEILKFSLNERGYSAITISGNQLRAGMYLYSLLVDGKEIDTKRMILTNDK